MLVLIARHPCPLGETHAYVCVLRTSFLIHIHTLFLFISGLVPFATASMQGN
ncbi:hypothetical protein BDV93DRAFT_14870 [Ceratobasidium sp. AG-I]|nr:hypothetical protein BDV93DRAFT_14870 [Ceratobasidium sp. AG-I]